MECSTQPVYRRMACPRPDSRAEDGAGGRVASTDTRAQEHRHKDRESRARRQTRRHPRPAGTPAETRGQGGHTHEHAGPRPGGDKHTDIHASVYPHPGKSLGSWSEARCVSKVGVSRVLRPRKVVAPGGLPRYRSVESVPPARRAPLLSRPCCTAHQQGPVAHSWGVDGDPCLALQGRQA